MHQEKEYKCQSCFQKNSVSIEMTFCSETVDVIEDCKYAVIQIQFLIQ